jgi:hypothetical protein
MAGDEYNFADVFQAIYIPKQKPAPDPVPDSMIALASSYPPLGQVTQLRYGTVSFATVLEVHESRGKESWQVALWYSIDGETWADMLLLPADTDHSTQSLQDGPANVVRLHFMKKLSIKKSMQFTLKVRAGENESWRWIRDEQGSGDGIIIMNDGELKSDAPETLGDLIKDLNPAWEVSSVMSQSPGTTLWSLKASIKHAEGDNSAYADVPVGIPWGSFLR